VKKKFSASAQSWDTVRVQEIEYYDDGDMKLRVTEDKVSGETTKETWADTKTATGRKKSTTKM
jgi:hypothetical protein